MTPRCPVCGKDTSTSRGFEQCRNIKCPTDTITRNARGEADEARNRRGQLTYQRRMRGYMNDDTGPRIARPIHRDGNFGADPGAGAGNEFLFGGPK